MTTTTSSQAAPAIPAQRKAVEPLVWSDLPSCSYTGDPVPDMDDHALHCGDCFAHHVKEN